MPRLRLVHKLSLAGEILRAYLRVRWLMHTRELPGTVAALRSAPGRRRLLPLAAAGRDGAWLGGVVVRTLRLLPTDSRCLMRSLVLLRLLACRGLDGQLIIAVRPTDAKGLEAHAWVELDGRPLLAPATEEYGRLLTL